MKTHVPWSEIHTACDNIARQATVIGVPDCIVAISRGGLIPARLVAENLNIKHIYSFGLTSYNDDNKQQQIQIYQNPLRYIKKMKHKAALIVDEIADSGNTFKYLSKLWLKSDTGSSCSCIFSAMYVKEHCQMEPSIYHKKITDKKWLVFPWEAKYWHNEKSHLD